VIHLDTHVVAWLAGGEIHLLPPTLRRRLNTDDCAISPMVELELAYLHEIGRLTQGPERVLAELRRSVGLQVDDAPFGRVTGLAATAAFAFTRDPFDRLIAAQASVLGVDLATKDATLREHLDFAIWD